jgi:signal transduction histidine kinase
MRRPSSQPDVSRPRHDTLPGLDIEGIGVGPLKLEDLVDREALREMVTSVERLFGIPIRVLSAAGSLLADAATPAEICAYVYEHEGGRRACDAIVSVVKGLPGPEGQPVTHNCFTGAVYRVLPIEYDRRAIGRVVLGPYLPTDVEVGTPKAPDASGVPPTLLQVEPRLRRERSAQLLTRLPRADEVTIERVSAHLVAVLDVILFSGHRALLTSKMHLASIRESYRELSEKTQKLEEAYERLKDIDRLKSNFLATVSHELRTPLTSIMGYSEMLDEGIAGKLNTEQSEFVQTIRAKSDQLLGLIMSLLDLSKLESGTALVSRGEVSIALVLAEAVSTLAPSATKKSVTLHVDAPEDVPKVMGDPDRLRQVFINLAENAIKFTPAGGTVSLHARAITMEPTEEPGLVLVAPLRQAVEVRVVDTGIGIPDRERARVFDPFYQIDQSSTREHGGTGLGLSIVKRLVEAHHGGIHIEQNEPRGAVFAVTLPVARVSFPPPPNRQTPPPGGSSVPPRFR